LASRAHGEYAIADDERRAVRTQPLIELDAGGGRGVFEFPECLAARGVQSRDDLLLSGSRLRRHPEHRVEAAVLDHDRRVTVAERAAPQLLRTARGPARCQALAVRHEVAVRSAPLRPRGIRLAR